MQNLSMLKFKTAKDVEGDLSSFLWLHPRE